MARRQRKEGIQTEHQEGQRHNKVIRSEKWRELRILHREWGWGRLWRKVRKKNHKWP